MKLYFDKSVYFSFLSTVLIAFFALIFRLANKKDIILNYSIPEKAFKGEYVKFSDQSIGAETWEWDFGDGNGKSFDQNTDYVFKTAGDYMVTLRVNDEISGQKKITVETKIILFRHVTPIFDWKPTFPKTGDEIKFRDFTPEAISWDWEFDKTWETSAEQQPSHAFAEVGSKTIHLKVSGADFKCDTIFKIYVQKKVQSSYSSNFAGGGAGGGHISNNAGSKGSGFGNRITTTTVMADIKSSYAFDLCPYKTTGDFEFNGHMNVSGSVELSITSDKKKIIASVYANFIENGGRADTKASIDGNLSTGQIILFVAPGKKKITKIETSDRVEIFNFTQQSGNYQPMHKEYSSFVHKIEVVGDVKGKDLPCDGSTNKSRFRIYFNDFKVILSPE